MGMLEDSLNQTIAAQRNTTNCLFEERREATLREQLLHEDLKKFTAENDSLTALNNGLIQKINLLEEEKEELRAQIKELIDTKALKIINLAV